MVKERKKPVGFTPIHRMYTRAKPLNQDTSMKIQHI